MEEQHSYRARARKGFFSSREFWLGAATIFFLVIIAYGLAIMFVG